MEELSRQRSGGVVILMKKDNVNYLIGEEVINVLPLEPYSELVCDFLDEVSKELRKDQRTAAYPDVMAVAFWCRKSNILKLKEEYGSKKLRLGRGLVFHVAPSNVPVNFAFSFFFGLLSGNGNIVRVPSKDYGQILIICDSIKNILQLDKYKILRGMNAFISYPKEDEITAYYSSVCDARIIWGGDNTIHNLRRFPLKERTVEVVFADRYSFAIINSQEVIKMSSEDLKSTAEKFYNDTFLMDQNACSTPHLILWYGESKELEERAKNIFWKMVHSISIKYDLQPIKVIDKYTRLCHLCMDREDIQKVNCFDNYLYTVDLKKLPEDICQLRGIFGLFYQYDINNLEEIIPCVNTKIQTLTYVGMDPKELAEFVVDNHLMGIDRIVPMGSSLDVGVYWDGYDIITSLSRNIEYR